MNLLKIYLKDCYGIGELDHTLNFEVPPSGEKRHKMTNIIYAHNGVMKTSLAKTFEDISQDRQPVDHIHQRLPQVNILADSVPIDQHSIFVVHSHSEYFESDKMMTLLADQSSQERYVEIMDEINGALDALLDHTASKIGLIGTEKRERVKELYDELFQTNNETRLTSIISRQSDVQSASSDFLNVSYKIVNDPKVTAFLDKASTHTMLNDYVATYESLVSQSKYFSDGLYDYTNATDVQKSMNKNNFMKAKNRVVIVSKNGDEQDVDSIEKLAKLYEDDKAAVFSSLELKQKYEKFDKEIGSNEQMRSFREWVKKNQNFIPQLQSHKNLRKQTWLSYFSDSGELYENLVESYNTNKDELSEIYKRSVNLQSEWQATVDKFNDSFVVPFTVAIRNKRDVVLDRSKPQLEFTFKDDRGGSPKTIDISLLTGSSFSVLSKGESRALFILCVMFEIESRIKDGGQHLIVLDDIADSFDYKNKYAIIEYLHNLSESSTNGINLLVLTHNFDFYRAFRLRCGSHWNTTDRAYIATRKDRGVITLNPAGNVDEFQRLQNDARTDPKAFLALIPFARNLTEYASGISDPHYTKLTSCVHIKPDTGSLVLSDITSSISAVVGQPNLTAYNNSDNYLTFLHKHVQDVVTNGDETLIEHKIILSLAIRIAVEEYIQRRFAHDGLSLPHSSRQTGKWYSQFIAQYGHTDTASKVLNRAMIITPESLHFNSFMYEPIMDLSIEDLTKLYIDIQAL